MSSDQADRAELLGALDRAMRQLSTQTVVFSQTVAERVGMHPTDMECLDLFSWTGPIPAGRLAELSGLTSGAITGVIDRLEEAGYVRRERDPHDRRRVIVRPVPGERERRIDPFFGALQGAMAELCSSYSDRQLALILDFATRAHRVLQEQTIRLQEGRPPAEA